MAEILHGKEWSFVLPPAHEVKRRAIKMLIPCRLKPLKTDSTSFSQKGFFSKLFKVNGFVGAQVEEVRALLK